MTEETNNKYMKLLKSEKKERKSIKTFTGVQNVTLPRISRSKRKSVFNTHNLKLLFRTEDEKEEEEKIMNKFLRNATPCDICIQALKKNPLERSENFIKIISFYLQVLKNFMNIFKDQVENEELHELLYNISSQLKHEHIPKNKFIFKFGDKADKFYIILKGKVTFCVPKPNNHSLTEEEYILYLIKLRYNKEIDLIKKNMETNKYTYDLGDNFEQFVLKFLKRHEKEEENIYSNTIYSYFKNIKEMNENERKNKRKEKEKEKEEIKYEDIKIEDYIENSSINLKNMGILEESKKKKKLLEIYRYEITNTFESGDCFGLIGSNNKSQKRSATAITYEDCDLAVLNRDEYKNILDKITKKARERLYSLVISHKIFSQISKRTFGNKYSHMFRFSRFYFNNLIMDDSIVFDKIILFNSGEFILSVNKNIIELNELIVKMKKIKGKLFNIPEEQIKKDLSEIKENESFKLNKKYTSNAINEYIYKRRNVIISTVNDKMMLGYPDTVDQETFIPLFNCKCISTSATGYIVERKMYNLFKKDHYIRTTPSDAILTRTEFYLKRLLQHKNNLMKKIEMLRISDNKVGKNANIKSSNLAQSNNEILNQKNNDEKNEYISINENNDNFHELNKENNLEKKNIVNEEIDNSLNITRNNINPVNVKNNNIFEFQTRIISSKLDNSLLKNKKNNNLNLTKVIKNNNNKSLDNTLNQKNEYDDNFLNEISKLKEKIKKKKLLLRIVQNQSQKFINNENIERKKIQLKLNKLIDKENYNDLTSIFSKNPPKKNSILNKYIKREDNILDPAINYINKQISYDKKFNSILSNSNNHIEKHHYLNFPENNISINNNINNNNIYKKIRNKLLNINSENKTYISNIKTIDNIKSTKKIKRSLNFSPNISELNYIKLNKKDLSLDVDKIQNDFNLNKSKLKTLSNELYNDYIVNEHGKNYIKNNLNDKSFTKESHKNEHVLLKYKKLDNYITNKFQLMKINRERKIKNFSPTKISQKNGISLVDPLALDKFNEIFKKERLNTNI